MQTEKTKKSTLLKNHLAIKGCFIHWSAAHFHNTINSKDNADMIISKPLNKYRNGFAA